MLSLPRIRCKSGFDLTGALLVQLKAGLEGYDEVVSAG